MSLARGQLSVSQQQVARRYAGLRENCSLGLMLFKFKKNRMAGNPIAIVKVRALYLPFIVQGFWSLPDNCPSC